MCQNKNEYRFSDFNCNSERRENKKSLLWLQSLLISTSWSIIYYFPRKTLLKAEELGSYDGRATNEELHWFPRRFVGVE